MNFGRTRMEILPLYMPKDEKYFSENDLQKSKAV